jgi:hypothetical protein
MSDNTNGLLIKIKGIREVASKSEINENIVSNYNEDNVQFKIAFSINGNPDENTAEILLFLKFSLKIEKKFIEFFSFNTSTEFVFKDLDEKLIKIEDDEIFIEDELAEHLMNIAVGSTRGMMIYKTSNFPFKLLLPLFDTSELVRKVNDKTK